MRQDVQVEDARHRTIRLAGFSACVNVTTIFISPARKSNDPGNAKEFQLVAKLRIGKIKTNPEYCGILKTKRHKITECDEW